MKKPIRAEYVKKYGILGDKLWRMDLLKYNEAADAYKRAQANNKAIALRAIKEKRF